MISYLRVFPIPINTDYGMKYEFFGFRVCPEAMLQNPVNDRSRLVLPQPDGPVNTVFYPLFTIKLKSLINNLSLVSNLILIH